MANIASDKKMNNAWSCIEKIKKEAQIAITNKKYNKALQSVSACAEILYYINQTYIDEELEDDLKQIMQGLEWDNMDNITIGNSKKVLFYDGFGDDYRGLARIYLRALISNGYQVFYVTYNHAEGKLPLIHEELKKGKAECIFLSKKRKVEQIQELNKVFLRTNATIAFFYTLPWDVVGTVVFRKWENKIKRLQINLTDHAFWLGKYSFDKCIEFRDCGAGISKYKRGISAEKIIRLPYYPIINDDIPFQGFPFEKGDKKVIFSGGSLYKTYGDDNKYYKMVESILKQNKQVIFWYAGAGDATELEKLILKYPKRCFWTPERADLFEVLKHCDMYLNTYPIAGAMMMQYAALAGLPPLTLKHNYDVDGTLEGQEELEIVFTELDELLSKADEIINNFNIGKADELKKSVVTEEMFQSSLQNILEEKESGFPILMDDVDTKKFLDTYVERYSFAVIEDIIISNRNINLWKIFPSIFLKMLVKKTIQRVKYKLFRKYLK